MVTGVPCQEGAEGNVAGRKKRRSKEAKLGNLLKYKAWLTRRSSVRGNEYSLKDKKNKAKTAKTELENGKSVKSQSQSRSQ
ncbi:hypothetical protein Tco_1170905 [Tanacetum coccineum]